MPLDENTVSRARAIFDARIHKRLKNLGMSIATYRGELARRGFIHDSSVIERAVGLAESEIEILAGLAWGDLRMTVERLNAEPPDDLEESLKDDVRAFVASVQPQIQTLLNITAESQEGKAPDLQPFVERALLPVFAEIGVYSDEKLLATPPEADGHAMQNVFNFSAPVGTVVTGAQAHVIVENIRESREPLLRALESVTNALATSQNPNSRYIQDLARDIRDEVTADQPNPVKFGGLLNTLMQAIQTIPEIRPTAMELANAAAFMIGSLGG